MHRCLTGIVFLMMVLPSCSAGTPAGLGLKQGRLAPCPQSPNCVSSQADDEKHGMEPIPYSTSLDQARERMRSIVLSMPRSKILADTGDYMHVEFKSKLWRFVDDVEFQFDDSRKLIQFRSASRVGYSDMGVNRKRMETIRRKFEQGLD